MANKLWALLYADLDLLTCFYRIDNRTVTRGPFPLVLNWIFSISFSEFQNSWQVPIIHWHIKGFLPIKIFLIGFVTEASESFLLNFFIHSSPLMFKAWAIVSEWTRGPWSKVSESKRWLKCTLCSDWENWEFKTLFVLSTKIYRSRRLG